MCYFKKVKKNNRLTIKKYSVWQVRGFLTIKRGGRMQKLSGFIFLFFLAITIVAQENLQKLTVGYVMQDHHSALFVAATNPDRTKKDCNLWLEQVEARKRYSMMENGKKVADVEFIVSGGGGKMTTLMSQGQFEVGFGGVAAVANVVDKGGPIKMISPLHIKGNMLVLKTGIPVNSWTEFVAYAKNLSNPLRIGIKDPVSVARVMFEKGLITENIQSSGDVNNRSVKVHLINMKGEEFLNPALANNLIDGYVSNNPACAISEEKGLGKCVVDLDQLPPGIWKDHPCCCIGATNEAIAGKPKTIERFLMLMILATKYINEDNQVAVKAASDWLGTSVAVETKSIATSGFTMKPTAEWKKNFEVWVDEMNKLEKFSGRFKGKKLADVEGKLFSFDMLLSAYKKLETAGVQNLY